MSTEIPARILQRVCLWFSMRLGDSAKETCAKMKTVFRGQCYSNATIYRLHKEYREGRQQVGDKLRTGQPLSSRTANRIRECDRLVKRNRCVGIVELSKTLGISYGSVFRILHKDLLLKKGHQSWCLMF